MAKKFKDYYDLDCTILLADKIKAVWPEFNGNDFVAMLKDELADKEFMQRQDAFVDAFEVHLPNDYQETVSIFHQILGPELETTTGMLATGWWLWPIGRYIERNGNKDFHVTVNFIYELTKRFTGEFAIRPRMSRGRGFDNPLMPFALLPCLFQSIFQSGVPLTPSLLTAPNTSPSFRVSMPGTRLHYCTG